MRLLLACLFFLTIGHSLAATTAPNVIIILADDLGWSDTTLYGTTTFYQTPNLERLAKRGMTFTRAYSASPLCSPTRSALLTGLSPARTGITTPNCHMPQVVLQATTGKKAPPDQKALQPVPPTRLKTEYRTLAETMKDAGYATAHFGKWHLGPEPYSPLQQGFDVDLPHHPGPGPAGSFVAPWKFANFKEKSPGEHIEDRMAAEAVAWMEQRKDQPFYMNYWMFSVHAPFDAKKANIEKHRARIDPKDEQRSPTYAAMIESMDDAIGTLLDALDRLKLADNTIVIFTADNGGNMYNEIDGTTPTSNRPLRGGKATVFEGGTRVPGIIVWPGIAAAGSRSDAIIQSEDYYPTLLEGLALKPAADQRFDGASLLPALKGDSLAGKAVFQYFPHQPGVPDHLPASVSVHRDDWKLIRIFHDGEKGAHRHLLFNLKDDLGERANLAPDKPELVTELDAMIETFLTETKAVVPVPNPHYDPNAKPAAKGKSKAKAKGKKPARVGPWTHSKDAQLRLDPQALVITSTGGDPWIATTDLPAHATGPFSLKLRLKTTARGPALVYFTTAATETFNIAQTVPFKPAPDGQFHDVTVTLPVPKLHSLRLDPGNTPGQTDLTRLSLHDPSGAEIKAWLPARQ
jgi:arylsulfatase A-like enzyme